MENKKKKFGHKFFLFLNSCRCIKNLHLYWQNRNRNVKAATFEALSSASSSLRHALVTCLSLSLMILLHQWRSPYSTSSFYSSPHSSSPSPSSSSPPITSDSLSLLSPPTTHHSPNPQTTTSLPTKLHTRWRWSSTLPTRRWWWSGISVKALNLLITFLVWTIVTPLSSSNRGGIWNIVSGIVLNQPLSVSCPCRIITSRRFRGLRAVTWWETDHLLIT